MLVNRGLMMKTTLVTTAIAVALGATSVHATLVFTDRTAFDNALSAFPYTPVVHGFDDDALDGQTISIGTVYDGITFTNASVSPGISMAINRVAQPTQTNPQQIGTTDGTLQDTFRDGDGFSFSFAPSVAIGLYFQEGNDLTDNDLYTLTVDSLSTSITSTGAGTRLDSSGTYVWFLGIIDDSGATFTSASVSSRDVGGTSAQWTADSFITAGVVPVPATVALLAIGLGVFGASRRRNRG
jgi:hypothetical protein